jgi:hypothetical protein
MPTDRPTGDDVLIELELGERVAAALREADQCWWNMARTWPEAYGIPPAAVVGFRR